MMACHAFVVLDSTAPAITLRPMRIPSAQETIDFFSSVGYCVERIASDGAADQWLLRLSDQSTGPVYPSIIDLWAEWLHHAAHLLIEDDKLSKFMKDYRSGDAAKKAELKFAVAAFTAYPNNWQALTTYTDDPYPRSPDLLPRNWKARVRQILSEPGGNTHFPERARLALAKLDLEP